MSTAPRPHTSPSMSSPPNGSWRQPSGLTGTTSVWPISSSVGRGRVGALDAGHEAGATGRRLVALEVEAGALEVGLEQIRAADLAGRSPVPSFTQALRMSCWSSSVTSSLITRNLVARPRRAAGVLARPVDLLHHPPVRTTALVDLFLG